MAGVASSSMTWTRPHAFRVKGQEMPTLQFWFEYGSTYTYLAV